MNRTQAIKSAQNLAQQYSIGPDNAHIATSFTTDEKVKTFVELEHGGKSALINMIQSNLYQPYTWAVRLFKPLEQREGLFYFTSTGIPYGFKEQLSETDERTNLSESSAQKLAESTVTATPWNIPLLQYKLVESSQETTPFGRINRSFMYERLHESITYRLLIIVSGDHISTIYQHVKIPESFLQKYNEMRSKNENIAYLGTLLMILLYGIGGCVFGLYYLTKKRIALYKPAFFWALGIACAIGLTVINKLPLHWMNYNTSHSAANFLLQIAILVMYNVVFLTFMFALIFITAEGLTRVAFPEKIQFWKLFNPSVASSFTLLGYTVGGYLFIPFALSYLLLFYFFTTTYCGWWTPTSALFDPDILATYFPWIESVSLSLQAGFFEECLFRAIPLASAALLGNRYGKKNWWIAAAFIIQALIFGAAHANYPSYPAYARLIELILISFFFGGIYLRFGLLTSIISHFGYDVLLFALPIFSSTAPGALINKCMVIGLSLTPLWIVLAARIRKKKWLPVSTSFLNKSWHPLEIKKTTTTAYEKPSLFIIKSRVKYLIVALGFFGFAAWITTTRFQSDSPTISTTRQEALQKATDFLKKQKVEPSEWTSLANPITEFSQIETLNKQHRFIWQKERALYSSLMGSYLTPPHWIVRFVKFNGSLTQKAEEHLVYLNPDGSFLRYVHKVPEEMETITLSRDEAISHALTAIESQFALSLDFLQQVSAQAIKHPLRTDWTITYKDTSPPLPSSGEKHITIQLIGDQVADSYRSIHVDEQWSRTEDNQLILAAIITKLCQLFIYLLLLIGAFITIKKWGAIQIKTPFLLLVALLAIFIFELFNAYPTKIFIFSTSQPFFDQLFRTFGITSILLLVRAILLALLISFVSALPQRYYLSSKQGIPLLGISIGLFFAGLQSLLTTAIPITAPTWANYTPLRFLSPVAVAINSLLLNYLTLTAVVLFSLIVIQSISFISDKKRYGALFFILLGFLESGIIYADNIHLFIVNGFITGAAFCFFYYILLRYNYAAIPIATATYLLAWQFQEAIFNNFTNSVVIHSVASLIVVLAALVWYRTLNRHTGESCNDAQ